MSPEQDDFRELRRLLALKRHEQPPPGYFHDFSRQVIARIQAGEAMASESWFSRILQRAPWLQAAWTGFEAKPIVAGAFGIGVCSLLLVGLISSERLDSAPVGLTSGINSQSTILAHVPGQSEGLFERAFVDRSATGSVFTAQSHSSIFDEIQKPHVQTVNFSVPAQAN